MTVPKCIYGNNNKNNLRKIEAQIVQKLKNNKPQPKFTGSYKEKSNHVVFAERDAWWFGLATVQPPEGFKSG